MYAYVTIHSSTSTPCPTMVTDSALASRAHSIPNPFTIVCWNACSLLARAPAIQLYLQQQRPSILIILEPRISSTNQIPHFPFYTIMHIPHRNSRPSGDIVLYIHTSITCYTLSLQPPPPPFTPDTSSNCVPLIISSPILTRSFLLFPTYMSCDARSVDWLTLEATVETARGEMDDHFHDIPYLLIGDMNARHPLWDPWCRQPNTGGNHINSILLTQHDWHLLNNQLHVPTPTHYANAPPYSTSIIDHAVTNNTNFFHQMEIDNASTLLSDHRAIRISLICRSHPLSIPLRHVWRTHDTNVPWDMFQAELTITLQPWRSQWEHLLSHNISVTQQDIDACWTHLRTIITNAASATIGKKVIRSTSQHWFTINPSIPQLHRKYQAPSCM